jgi:hypothetical protein
MKLNTHFENGLTGQIADFLNEIGIETLKARLDVETFLPGILVERGKLLVDEDKLVYPGDLLHEAGHLAVVPAALRAVSDSEIELPDVDPDLLEGQAISWSYAACVHLGIDPRLVFHEGGYKGNSEHLLLSFGLGVFFGISQLEAAEMTYTAAGAAAAAAPFPAMRKWVLD